MHSINAFWVRQLFPEYFNLKESPLCIAFELLKKSDISLGTTISPIFKSSPRAPAMPNKITSLTLNFPKNFSVICTALVSPGSPIYIANPL